MMTMDNAKRHQCAPQNNALESSETSNKNSTIAMVDDSFDEKSLIL